MDNLNSLKIHPSGIVRLSKDIGLNILYAPFYEVKELLGEKENFYSSVEVFLKPESIEKENYIKAELAGLLPDNSIIKNRLEQNETAYKIMQAEKFAVYMILFFVILIISINLFSSLSMLIIDKSSDIQSFKSLGATESTIKKIFHIHGFLISLIGCLIGVTIGITLCFIQQHFGVITIPGNYLISAYPVKIELVDILITIAGVSFIGYIIAYLPVRKLTI
jgi:ABC-type transport system, involved in lipoprotein release, permease component